MCGRFFFSLFPNEAWLYEQLFGIAPPEFEYPPILKDDILPFDHITAIYSKFDKPHARPMFWNLIPKNAPKFEPTRTWFNTRKEKLGEPYQRNLLRFQRCVIPMNGFLENKKAAGKPVYHSRKVQGKRVRKKESYAVQLKGQPLMMLGGIYDIWGEDQYSCSIITLEPNALIDRIHDRMPFILPNDKVKLWLDTNLGDVDFLLDLIQPLDSRQLTVKQTWPPDEDDEGEEPQMDLFG